VTARRRAGAVVLLVAACGAEGAPPGGLDSASGTEWPAAGEFDCANSFDMFAAFVMLRCANSPAAAGDRAAIEAAEARLRRLGTFEPTLLDATDVEFCPLLSGTGITPAPGRVYIDDGLRVASPDGLAEVIAHELVHVQQFERLGAREFKCTYVRDMAACGGCQDEHHALERAAYRTQDVVRTALLREAGVDLPRRTGR
jgi:hypothetical protein